MIPWLLQKVFGTKHERELKKIRPLVAAINACSVKKHLLHPPSISVELQF